jgi:ATP-dependent Lhr-like helicase
MPNDLPPTLQAWFDRKGWALHPHQLQMLARCDARATLLIAPTGCGKTMAGFLPSLVELAEGHHKGLHTLYISPLKALATDIKRNLRAPVAEMGLDLRIEDRTGDTSATQKRKQRADPPHILLTTPESLALLTSYSDAHRIFSGLKRVVVDEIHALSESKRGDQLMLALAALQRLCPNMQRVGLSATVEDPHAISMFLACYPDTCEIIHAAAGPLPDIEMLQIDVPAPWSGGGASYAIPAVLLEVARHKTTLIFHNTRAQAEIFFRNLWLANETDLPIGIHHGSLSRDQRARVEEAMVRGQLRAIVCTGSLDLGIDWGDVDLVIQVGAPKNVKRLLQRIGRANHCFNTPSKARLVPANRFEVVECVAALEAVRAHDLDGDPYGKGSRDVLCQHILITACAGPFAADNLYAQVITVGRYTGLSRSEFDDCLEFCATGGYALKGYDRWHRLLQTSDGKWQLRDPRTAQRIRMNIGTIQDTDLLKVRLRGRGGKSLGEVEEAFAATLSLGDTFLIGGQVVCYEGLREMTVEVSRKPGKKPKIATFSGTKFATSTQLSKRILDGLKRLDWPELPLYMRNWISLQRQVSKLPQVDRLLVETFPYEGRSTSVFYGFAGRNAMQTLGLLLSKRMEDAGLAPLGFVATDYAVMIWGLEPVTDPAALLGAQGLRDGLETWLAGNAVMKRTFRTSAVIAGLIERNLPGSRKSGRQATFSSDILYDTLLKYDPEHVLMQITREEARKGLVDFDRIEEMLKRISGRIDHVVLERVTPFAAPLLLEMGRIPVKGQAEEQLLAEETARLMQASGINQIDLMRSE